MQSSYACLNLETFDIESNNVIPVDKQLAKTISILNKKAIIPKCLTELKLQNLFW